MWWEAVKTATAGKTEGRNMGSQSNTKGPVVEHTSLLDPTADSIFRITLVFIFP